MAPLKFEEHIKDKMEQRKLQPSADAWERLNNQLDSDASKKKNNKAFWWLGIAASIVGVFLVVTVMINSEKQNTIIPTIVETENIDPTTNDVDFNNEITNSSEDNKNNTEDHITEEKSPNKNRGQKQKPNKPTLLKQQINTEQNKLVPTTNNDAVADVNMRQNEENKPKKVNVIKALTNEDLRVQAVAAEIRKLQEQNASKLDSELDALLNEAQKEIALEKLYKQAIETVNADALLEGVEQDIDISFRDRVFNALKDSYKTVKTAVAERNN